MANSPKIEIRNLYKIFGSDPKTALEKVKAGMGKEALLNDTGHVFRLAEYINGYSRERHNGGNGTVWVWQVYTYSAHKQAN